LVGNIERKKILRKNRYSWQNNIKIYPKKWDGTTWIGFIWFVAEMPSCCEHGDELWGSMKGEKSP